MSQPVVLRRARLATAFTWGCLGPFFLTICGVLLVAVVASNLDAIGRGVAAIALLGVVAYLRWIVPKIPRVRDTLVVTIDDRTVTARHRDKVTTVPRRDVWFAEVREVHYRGVPYLGLHAHDGHRIVGWETGWHMATSSWTVRRRLSRAGLPWVHVYNGAVWKREGIGPEADDYVGLP